MTHEEYEKEQNKWRRYKESMDKEREEEKKREEKGWKESWDQVNKERELKERIQVIRSQKEKERQERKRKKEQEKQEQAWAKQKRKEQEQREQKNKKAAKQQQSDSGLLEWLFQSKPKQTKQESNSGLLEWLFQPTPKHKSSLPQPQNKVQEYTGFGIGLVVACLLYDANNETAIGAIIAGLIAGYFGYRYHKQVIIILIAGLIIWLLAN